MPVEAPQAHGATQWGNADPLEATFSKALGEAAAAGRFDVVAQLAKELEARRLAGAINVVSLDALRSVHRRSPVSGR
jgi:hypothetical protein